MPAHENDHPLHAGINAKLAEIVGMSPAPPPWYDAWTRLGPQSTHEERLAVYWAVRDAGSVPTEAGFFLVAWMLDLLTDERAEESLREPEARLESIRQKHGLDPHSAAEGDNIPAEYVEAMQQVHNAWDELYAATLRDFGEHDMARLFQEDQDEFDDSYEAGRQFFHGPDDDDTEQDDWLDILRDAVAACIEVASPMGPMGLRYTEEEGFWQVFVFPTPVELVGGAQDGAVVEPGFSLDLEQLRDAFESIVAFGWNAQGLTSYEGPYVHIEGFFQGREVYLQILAYPPEDEKPWLKIDMTNRPRKRK